AGAGANLDDVAPQAFDERRAALREPGAIGARDQRRVQLVLRQPALERQRRGHVPQHVRELGQPHATAVTKCAASAALHGRPPTWLASAAATPCSSTACSSPRSPSAPDSGVPRTKPVARCAADSALPMTTTVST